LALRTGNGMEPDEFESAFRGMARARADGLLVLPDTMLYGERARLADLVAKSRLPTMFGFSGRRQPRRYRSPSPSTSRSRPPPMDSTNLRVW
jgi:hypothetical protein